MGRRPRAYHNAQGRVIKFTRSWWKACSKRRRVYITAQVRRCTLLASGSASSTLVVTGNVCSVMLVRSESRRAKASGVHTEEMKQPVSQIPAVLEQSIAPSTARKYKSTFKRWQAWASKQGVLSMPADPLYISLYLVKKINDSRSPAPGSDALHSIAWMHQISGRARQTK